MKKTIYLRETRTVKGVECFENTPELSLVLYDKLTESNPSKDIQLLQNARIVHLVGYM